MYTYKHTPKFNKSGGVAQWLARPTRNWWMLVVVSSKPQRLPLGLLSVQCILREKISQFPRVYGIVSLKKIPRSNGVH